MASTLSSTTSKDAIAYINGLVYTVNKAEPWVEAFIVSAEGKFTALGTTQDIQAKAKQDGLVVYDLRGQFIMPGIHDAHMHVSWAGLALIGESLLEMDTTPDNLAERIAAGACACAYGHSRGDWVNSNTFIIPEFDRSCLDEKYPDTPVFIRGGAGHSIYTNTALLKESGYDIEKEPDQHGARFVRRSDGSLTGELSELAMDKAMLAMPRPALSHIKRALLKGIREAHKVGVTSLQEPGVNSGVLAGLSELEREGRVNMDVYAHIVDAPVWLGAEPREDLHALIDIADQFESKHVQTRFVKFILDGVPLPPLFTQVDLTAEGKVDEKHIQVAGLAERLLEHDTKKRTVKVHATGEGSVRFVLDAIETARKRNPNGPKHEIAHCNAVHDDDRPRFKQLNVTAELSPAFFFTHPLAAAFANLMDWNFNKFWNEGASTTIGSDWAGGYEPALLPHLAAIVEKVGEGSKERGGELLVQMMTLAGAEAVDRESDFGSIEVGKKANFIAVSSNVAKGEFEGAKVLKTWFEGELVWDANDP